MRVLVKECDNDDSGDRAWFELVVAAEVSVPLAGQLSIRSDEK